METEDILRFFFELGQLSRTKHEGWRLVGVEQPESVADHTLRAAQIGYVLARLEGYENPAEVCTMLVFHDIAETRVGDLHKLANRYAMVDEERATREQLARVGPIGDEILGLWKQVEERSTTAGKIAKDADLLDQAIRAREYIQQGYGAAQDWIDNIAGSLQTESARELHELLGQVDPYDWWKGYKRLEK